MSVDATIAVAKLRELAARDNDAGAPAAAGEFGDDRLALIFTCCHPVLPFEARVALTLRTLTGLTTAEIARAFLVSEDTMSKRLTRAKSRIRKTGVPFRVPAADERPDRLNSVLGVLYLLFNEGYAAIVRLNRAVAVGMLDPARGLALLDALSPDRGSHHLLPAARADLLRRQGRAAEAATAYREALALAPSGPERRHLARRLAEISP
ncbi:sigma factor-like helix-turn-helix DNA-binding protein [Actinoallomurus sp. NPDC052274]|uniref:sigma factor-like helix-turn-helix DNA-binding protein n=1 Tax=Actinoallomurus sp. NPDC052274 TaxID=3155420 RepID=UPI003444F3FE